MFHYKIFLPEFTRGVIRDACALLGKKDIKVDFDPTFSPEINSKFKGSIKISLMATGLSKWKFNNKNIVSGFDLRYQKFNLDKEINKQRKGVGNLFGLVKTGNQYVKFQEVMDSRDMGVIERLKTCTMELDIDDDYKVAGSWLISPLVACALAEAGKGLLYEDEFIQGNLFNEYWPSKDDIKYGEESDEDCEIIEFKGWSF